MCLLRVTRVDVALERNGLEVLHQNGEYRLKIFGLCLVLLLAFAKLATANLDNLVALAKQRYGDRGELLVTQWRQLLDTHQFGQEKQKLRAANDFFNRQITFSSDDAIWGRSDYWATPLETMGLMLGDCEDFSIAKYVTLLKMGVDQGKLRLTYVKADVGLLKPQAHMILAYYATPGAEPLILDNLSPEILPASSRVDLTPVFSFNSAGLWVGSDRQPKVKKPETRLSRWRDVLLRMRMEGLLH